VLDVVTPLFPTVLINSNCPDTFREWGLPVIPDVVPDKGALGGIYTALKHAPKHTPLSDGVFCVACDMPFLCPALIKAMCARAQRYDALIPQTPDGHHPLHAMYTARCLPFIESLLQEDRLKISLLFPLINTGYFGPKEIGQYDPFYESFMNLNTWDDVEAALRLLKV
jgi:molybdopterin-guanine dinucleotide biosynthesis protein A